jgi:RNA polymerase sigma factor (sigma-70 family)
MPMQPEESAPAHGTAFRTTHWGQVLAASQRDGAEADRALADLCESYWYPLYAFVRRKGHEPEAAQDLTQEFFARLLAHNYLQRADPRRGRFRTFLLSVFVHFLANEYHRERAQKRGGPRLLDSWDAREAEERCRLEPGDSLPPERVYDRQWAWTLLERVLGQLGADYAQAGKQRLFAALQPLLTSDAPVEDYRELGRQLDLSEAAVKVSVHRLRRRFGELLRAEVARTVAEPTEVESELRYLLAVVGEVV